MPVKPSLQSLLGMALQCRGSDASWSAIMALQMRGSAETLAMAGKLMSSRNWRKRALAMYVVSQLRQRRHQAPLESTEYAIDVTQGMLLRGLADAHVEVVRAAVSGMGHRPHPDALPALLRLASHANEDMRFGVAVALGRYSEPQSIDMLCRLACDPSAAVRDWATFGLGAMHEDVDTPQLRATLWARLDDPDEDVRGEALAGLALRKDPRVASMR